jgi:DNA-binding transcriptional ArsR family regulator
MVDDETLAGLRTLVDATRIRLYARLADGPADAATLAGELRLPLPAVNRHLQALLDAGLVDALADGRAGAVTFRARPDRIGALGRSLAAFERGERGLQGTGDGQAAGDGSAGGGGSPGDGPPGGGGVRLKGLWPHDGEPLADTLARVAATPDDARTLRAYLVDGRLTTIPAQPRKREVILRFLLERVFVEDREYPEKEVNQRLALFHPDVASLRRYLVDLGYVDRAAGLYRRRPR